MGEKWHYLAYDPATGDVIQESTVEFRGQATESIDDLRDRVVAMGRGFLVLDAGTPTLNDPSRWHVQNGALAEKQVDPVADWTEQYTAAQAAVSALEDARPDGVDLAQIDRQIAASAALEEKIP